MLTRSKVQQDAITADVPSLLEKIARKDQEAEAQRIEVVRLNAQIARKDKKAKAHVDATKIEIAALNDKIKKARALKKQTDKELSRITGVNNALNVQVATDSVALKQMEAENARLRRQMFDLKASALTFPSFGCLPMELRSQIWDLAMPARLVRFGWTKPPSLLAVCRESRVAALKTYKLYSTDLKLPTGSSTHALYFSAERDTLLCNLNLYRRPSENVTSLERHHFMCSLRSLALDKTIKSIAFTDVAWYAEYEMECEAGCCAGEAPAPTLHGHLLSLPALSDVLIIVDADSRCSPRQTESFRVPVQSPEHSVSRSILGGCCGCVLFWPKSWECLDARASENVSEGHELMFEALGYGMVDEDEDDDEFGWDALERFENQQLELEGLTIKHMLFCN